MSKIYAMDLEELMNTKVTIATKSDQTIGETPSVVSVITAEEIKNMGARELEDVLQTIPGFELQKKYAGYYGIGIRGVKSPRESSKLLILINGTPYNQIFYGLSITGGSSFDINSIERIEVIRGPGSALYGRNAFSGVVNIITKNALTDNKSYIKATLGMFNTRSLSGYYAYKKNKFSASFSFDRLYTDGTNTKFNDGYGDTVLWNIYHNNTLLNTNIGLGKFSFSGMLNIQDEGGTLNDIYREALAGYYALTYIDKLNPKLIVKSKLYGHNTDNTEHIEQLKPDISPVYPLGIYFTPHFNEYLYGIENEVNYKISLNNDLLFGIQADVHGVKNVDLKSNISGFDSLMTPIVIAGIGKNNQVSYDSGWFENDKHNYYNLALYGQDIWYPIKKIGITIGFRYDIDSEIGGVFNPRMGLVIEPANKLYCKFLYGKAYRAPSPAEQYKTFGFVRGNKDLRPEIINTFEFSLSYKTKHSIHTINLFYNKLYDVIYSPIVTSINPTKYYNIGKNNSRGLEYETKLVLGKELYSYFNYSFTISENTDTINGIDTTYNHEDIAPHKINFGINYSFLKYFNFNLNAFYRSKIDKFTVYRSGIPLGKVQNNIGDFIILNSTIRIVEPIKHLQFSISLYNLLNTKYYSQDNEHLTQPSQHGRQLIASIICTF
jgi:iron complex outermembrane receptor protein